MSESSEEYDGCSPPNTYSALVITIFASISLVGILLVVIAGSFVAYEKTNRKMLEKQMKVQIESMQQKQNQRMRSIQHNSEETSIIVLKMMIILLMLSQRTILIG